jgi:hypothetical protein
MANTKGPVGSTGGEPSGEICSTPQADSESDHWQTRAKVQ